LARRVRFVIMELKPVALAVQQGTPLLHSMYGFSAQSRILVCGGSVSMSTGLPNGTNAPAELGTAVHELVEVALKFGLSCYDLIGHTFNKHIVTEEMAEGGQVYVNYVRQIKIQRPNAKVYLELKVCLSSISDQLWGTSDLVIVDGDTLIVGDYKNGYGLVEVDGMQTITGFGQLNGNAQTVGYSLAAMDTLQLWGKINRVINVIVQPNNDEHVDGVIRTNEYNIEEITQWHYGYRAAHGRTDLVAGSHCIYCRAAGFCATRIRHTFDLIGLNDSIQRVNDDQMIALIDEIPTIKRTLDALLEQATLAVRKGKPLKDRKLVKGIVRGYCTDEDEFVRQSVYDKFGKQHTVTEKETLDFIDKMFNKPKLKGMTANKKHVDKNVVNKFYEKPQAPILLVPINDKRAAIAPDMSDSIAGIFKSIK